MWMSVSTHASSPKPLRHDCPKTLLGVHFRQCKYYKQCTCFGYVMNKTNRRTEFQFYWYYYSTCFGQSFCPSSGVLSRTLALVHYMQYIIYIKNQRDATWQYVD